MNSEDFRRLALELPETAESSHMGHPDFRVGGKIFATLGYPSRGWGMVKLSTDQQEVFVAARPGAFVPVKGAWGRGGATSVNLRAAPKGWVRRALLSAWRNTALKTLSRHLPDPPKSRRKNEP
jgi:hypothetical protein